MAYERNPHHTAVRRLCCLLVLVAASVAAADSGGEVYYLKAATDHAFPIVLVDAADGYTPETEKKAADTTITYCNISDGNTVSTYADDDTLWDEIGDATGKYKLVLGAGEFSTAGKMWFVNVAVTGCRDDWFVVYTTVADPNRLATTTSGRQIDVLATGEVGIDLDNVNGTLDADEIVQPHITAIPIVPCPVDLTLDDSVRFALRVLDLTGDLPSTAEITPGTITIETRTMNTNDAAWDTVVDAAACSEVAGMIYYDEVFEPDAYDAEDELRITFKSQKVTIGAADYEISGTTGWTFHSYVRKSLPSMIIYREL